MSTSDENQHVGYVMYKGVTCLGSVGLLVLVLAICRGPKEGRDFLDKRQNSQGATVLFSECVVLCWFMRDNSAVVLVRTDENLELDKMPEVVWD